MALNREDLIQQLASAMNQPSEKNDPTASHFDPTTGTFYLADTKITKDIVEKALSYFRDQKVKAVMNADVCIYYDLAIASVKKYMQEEGVL